MVAKPFSSSGSTLSTLRCKRDGDTLFSNYKNGFTVVLSAKASITSIVGQGFAQKHYRPSQVVLLLQGLGKDFSSAQMLQPEDALPATKTDEMFQNAGEKG